MTTTQQQQRAARDFAQRWQGKGYEKGESQVFWTTLLTEVFGVEHVDEFLHFEQQVRLDHTSFIDAYIPRTHVMIEQKSIEKDLGAPIKQSDGSLLNPFQQAKRYAAELPYSQRPRWIVTCNFREFWVYDMEQPNGEPQKILLKNLEKEYYRLQFLVDEGNEHLKREMEVSVKAGELVGIIYDKLLEQYIDKDSPETLRSLNILCVRLVFCLYAEDAGLFPSKTAFHDYLQKYGATDFRRALIDFFVLLDTPLQSRDPYLEDDIVAFPYVNGGLFSDEKIIIPRFTDEVKQLLLDKASADFDWSEISPTIFGAVFESTLNPETRRSGGMHYTSIENIHKVIDPLFMNDLRDEFDGIMRTRATALQVRQLLQAFQDKLASLTFLDPACGSGNFLTETFLSLRRLENEVIQAMYGDNRQIGFEGTIKVNISQFYGIEINDFACTVAKTALWIAESQTLKETSSIVGVDLNFLPLKTNAYIHEGNALRMDWAEVIAPDRLNYIMGNPPFVGQAMKTKEQSEETAMIFGKGSPETKLDYVLCWYRKALLIMQQNTNITSAFVSTNSICQGESVPTFWKNMVDAGAEIQFAHTNFAWASESSKSAQVYCVIVGFSAMHRTSKKQLYTNNVRKECEHINAYLTPASDIWIASRSKNDELPKMEKGSEPTDGGQLFLTKEEAETLVAKYPQLAKYIRKFIGGNEVIANKPNEFSRFCLWFVEATPTDFIHIPEIRERLKQVQELRQNSTADRIQKRADFPYLFCQVRQPNRDYIIIPRVSTASRKYIPLAYMDKDVICGDSTYIIGNTSLYLFGILNSNVHNAWTRVTCGRLGMAIRYTPAIYYNFPFPKPTEEQRARIETTAQAILDARAKYPNCSLSDLYDEIGMPPELRKAHQDNDRAVMAAYGFSPKMTESECVAELFKSYQQLTKS